VCIFYPYLSFFLYVATVDLCKSRISLPFSYDSFVQSIFALIFLHTEYQNGVFDQVF